MQSTSIALSGAAASPLGGGMRAMIASSVSSMPMPVLALVSMRVVRRAGR